MRLRIPPTLLLAISCLALCVPSLATQEQATRAQDSESAQTGSGISVEERTLAAQWGLTDVEWQRYRHLMRGLRGSLSVSTISPVEGLGIHADSESDRTRYAEMFVRLMQQDTERVLAFERAYHAGLETALPGYSRHRSRAAGGRRERVGAKRSPRPAERGSNSLFRQAAVSGL